MAIDDATGDGESFADRQARLNPPTAYGHPAYDRVGSIFKAATGRDGTQQEVSQWGNNIDDNYLNTISNAIYNTDEAKAYKAKQNAPAVTPTVQPATPPPPSTPPTSPVTATGGIPPPTPPTPQAATPPPAAPVASPQAIEARPDARTPDQHTPALPTYNPFQFTASVGATPGQVTYNPAATLANPNISQFAAPDQSAGNTAQNNVLNAVMANPEVMNPERVAQLKEQQKEQALLLGQQNNAQYAQSAVGRGTLNSGQTDAFRSTTNNNVNNAILSGNRNVDLSTAQTNRQNQLDALTASSGVAQDQLGRATGSYTTGLQGQLAKANSDLSTAGFNANQQFQGYQSQAAANDAQFQRALTLGQFDLNKQQAQAGQNVTGFQSQANSNTDAFSRALALAQNAQGVYGQDLSAQFGNQAQNLDLQKFLESNSQFTRSLNQNNNQFNSNLGFNYNQLDQNGQSQLMNLIASLTK